MTKYDMQLPDPPRKYDFGILPLLMVAMAIVGFILAILMVIYLR